MKAGIINTLTSLSISLQFSSILGNILEGSLLSEHVILLLKSLTGFLRFKEEFEDQDHRGGKWL